MTRQAYADDSLPLTGTLKPFGPGLKLTVRWKPPRDAIAYRCLLDGYPAHVTFGDGTAGQATFNPAETEAMFTLADREPHTVTVHALSVDAQGLLTVGDSDD